VIEKWNNFNGCSDGVPKSIYDMSLFRGKGMYSSQKQSSIGQRLHMTIL
jgi:hypothetical protein